MGKPRDVFDREQIWADLESFVSTPSTRINLGIVHGRRRTGKSFLLRRLVAEHGGFYHLALEESPEPALLRFSHAVAEHLGLPGDLRFPDWPAALRVLLRAPIGLIVIDEIPYLLAHPQGAVIESALQHAIDLSADEPAPHPSVILCGSALSVMSRLLSGRRALRGRATLDISLAPFDYRTSAAYYRISDPPTALRLDAIVGGTPGYRDLLGQPTLHRPSDVDALLAATVLNPSHALFGEAGYLLREDPRITDRSLYLSILAAVADGASTPSAIGARLGRAHTSLAHPLETLLTSGFLVRHDDVLLQRRPTLRIADPIVRFSQAIIRPRLAAFEDRATERAWAHAQPTFASQVLGPHFESICRTWTRRYSSPDTTGGEVATVGTTVVNDARGRAQHQVDVIALAPAGRARPVVRLLGEAKHSRSARPVSDLERLERIRDLLGARDIDVSQTRLAVFASAGFSAELRSRASARSDVELVDLDRLYAGD